MRKRTIVIASCLLLGVLGLGAAAAPLFAYPGAGGQGEGQQSFGCEQDQDLCVAKRFAAGAKALSDVAVPTFAAPTPPPQTPPASLTATYNVVAKGSLTASFSVFKSQVAQTLADARGWAQLGISFNQVAKDGDFTLVLSEASQVPTFSPGCDSTYSCRVGTDVIINETRWLNATSSWNDAGGTLRNYRHMVINHEVGHWLGHGHTNCGGAGQKAPVMQQQSIDLQGCTFNPWPLKSELHSSRFGV